jgi:hypothetical protein
MNPDTPLDPMQEVATRVEIAGMLADFSSQHTEMLELAVDGREELARWRAAATAEDIAEAAGELAESESEIGQLEAMAISTAALVSRLTELGDQATLTVGDKAEMVNLAFGHANKLFALMSGGEPAAPFPMISL